MSDRPFPSAGPGAVLFAMMLLAACGQPEPPPAAPATSPPPAAEPAAAADANGDAGTNGTRPRPAEPSAAATATLTDADDGRAVTLRRGQAVELRLEADRAAGFTWIPLQNVLPVMRTDGVPQYETAGDHAAGTEIWRFVAQEPGHAHLVFEYRRPFEPGAAPQRAVTFHFDVE